MKWVWRPYSAVVSPWMSIYPLNHGLPPTPMPTTRSQSARFFPLIPLSSPSLCEKNLHWDETWESVMPKEWFMMPPHFMPASQASHVAVVPGPCLSVDGPIFTWSQSIDTIASGSHLLDWHPRDHNQTEQPQPGFWVSLLFSHWRPDLHVISASAITVSVTLSQLLISLQGDISVSSRQSCITAVAQRFPNYHELNTARSRVQVGSQSLGGAVPQRHLKTLADRSSALGTMCFPKSQGIKDSSL